MKKIFLITVLISCSLSLFANESGFMFQGKMHVTFRDGEKVGQSYEEFAKAQKASVANSRKLSSITPAEKTELKLALFYEEDDLARCYFNLSGNGTNSMGQLNSGKMTPLPDTTSFRLFCVPKK